MQYYYATGIKSLFKRFTDSDPSQINVISPLRGLNDQALPYSGLQVWLTGNSGTFSNFLSIRATGIPLECELSTQQKWGDKTPSKF